MNRLLERIPHGGGRKSKSQLRESEFGPLPFPFLNMVQLKLGYSGKVTLCKTSLKRVGASFTLFFAGNVCHDIVRLQRLLVRT